MLKAPIYKEVVQRYQKIAATETGKSYFNILATLVLLIVLLLLIYPALRHIVKLNKEISDARTIKNALEEKVAAIEQARVNLAEVESDLPLLEAAVPIGSKMPEYLKLVEDNVKSRNLTLNSVQFSDIPIETPAKTETLSTKEIAFTLGVIGSFPDFKELLKGLEENIRTSNVQSFQLTKEGTGVKENIEIKSFYRGVDLLPDKKSTSLD